jgi:hypothetical protein
MTRINEEMEKHNAVRKIQYDQRKKRKSYEYLDDFIEEDVMLFDTIMQSVQQTLGNIASK